VQTQGSCDFNIYDMICRNAQVCGGSDCIVSHNLRLTHTEFKEKCDKLAAGLLGVGVEKGDRLGVVANNSAEFMLLYGAAAKIGAILLPVNWRFQQHEIAYVLCDCRPKLVFAGTEYRPAVTDAAKKAASIDRYYTIGPGEAGEGFSPFEELYGKIRPDDDAHPSADTGFVLIHTAAVEGQPRGALLSQANILYCNMQLMYLYALGEEDCCVDTLPFFHIAGLTMALAVMQAGGKNAVLERFDPERTLQLIHEEKGTILLHFPPMLKMIMEKYAEAEGRYNLSSLVHVAGLDQPENILRFKKIAPEARFWTAFGQTEAMPVTGGRIEERPGSAGKPTCLSRVILFDDHDNEVPVGTPGEICVRSPAVFSGYWGRDEDNAYTFRNGWHHTGDIGRFDEDGYLWYVKRKAQKELIKTGGENVYPAEVEKVILEHENVAEASVIGVPDEQWGEGIKAVCVRKPGAALEAEALVDFVASKIARYKKPKYVVFVDALPKNDTGEIDRDQVKKDHGGKY
jgi:acyl-CoA synthetase (AMP-forming)/AMP-acid ligase II